MTRFDRSQRPAELALSVVAPCYNEEAGLALFVARMEAACRAFGGGAFEIILVNDGSRDGTWAEIRAAAERHPGVVGVNLSRNHGHQLAVTAGLAVAEGARVLIIDADLQDPPELLEEMMTKMDAGADVVYARRRRRAGESAFKLVTANLFYRLLAALAEVDIPRDTGDFRLMSRRTVDRLNSLPEQDRFIRGMVAWLGGRQEEVWYDRAPRYAGVSAYGLFKMVRLALAGVTSFSTAPLRLASLMAAVGAMVGFGIIAYAFISYFGGHVAAGWTSLALLVTGFATAQFICTAVLGAYVGRIFVEAKRRPLYLIDDVVRRDDAPPPALAVHAPAEPAVSGS